MIPDRRINILKEEFNKSVDQWQKKDEDLKLADPSYKKPDETNKKMVRFKCNDGTKKLRFNQYWVLRHEKLFHKRLMSKFPLMSPVKSKRTKSVKKKIKFHHFHKLDSITAKNLKHPNKLKKHQRSVFEAIRKYAKGSGKSKISTESTACTITKINV
jgi:hypothetical protein